MLIALEGIDGSGKATQAKLLYKQLCENDKLEPAFFSFPAYTNTVAGPYIKRYLRGAMGPLDQNDPFLVALLYATDRAQMQPYIQCVERLPRGVVVCDRYVWSNIAHQGAKRYPDWQTLSKAIQEVEYVANRIPPPTLTFVLNLTAEQSWTRTHTRDDEADLHQDNIDYLRKVRAVYLELAGICEDTHVIECFDSTGRERSIEELHAEIWQRVSDAIDKRDQSA